MLFRSTSSWFELDNGIGQGDLLSMLLYLYYNSDVLEVPKGHDEMGLGYIDDMALVAVASDFRRVHQRLKQMMVRPGGAMEWSGTHNSRFEATKSTLLDFTRLKFKPRIPMTLQGVVLAPQVTQVPRGAPGSRTLLEPPVKCCHRESLKMGSGL